MDAATKLRQSLDLIDFGFEMHKQSLRRRHPEWSEQEVLAAFRRWLSERPMDAADDVAGALTR